MSEYIDKDKVLEYIIFGVVGKDITCGELKRGIESLPTIEVSDDVISRQAAIEVLSHVKDDEKWRGECIDNEIRLIQLLPPVEPKGEWKYGNGNGECPFCGHERQCGWDNYCGYCGARMRE